MPLVCNFTAAIAKKVANLDYWKILRYSLKPQVYFPNWGMCQAVAGLVADTCASMRNDNARKWVIRNLRLAAIITYTSWRIKLSLSLPDLWLGSLQSKWSMAGPGSLLPTATGPWSADLCVLSALHQSSWHWYQCYQRAPGISYHLHLSSSGLRSTLSSTFKLKEKCMIRWESIIINESKHRVLISSTFHCRITNSLVGGLSNNK